MTFVTEPPTFQNGLRILYRMAVKTCLHYNMATPAIKYEVLGFSKIEDTN